MNYKNNKYAYVVNWQDMNEKTHQDEIIRPGFYDGMSLSWIHTWNNIDDGLEYFLNPLPKFNTVVYKLTEYSLACLRSQYIVIPTDKLIKSAVEIKKINK